MSATNRKTTPEFLEFILAQLAYLPMLRAQAMFGGFGLYCDEVFFGIVHRDRFYMKVNEHTLPQLKAMGMKAFRPSAKTTLTSFYEVPLDVLESGETLRALVSGRP